MSTSQAIKCAVFWDIENVPVPKGTIPTDFVKKIRRLISDNSWLETNFFIVCDVLNFDRAGALRHLHLDGLTIIHVPLNVKNAADDKIKELLTRFVDDAGDSNVSVILLTGDADFASTSRTLKRRNNVTIYLIHNDNAAKCLIESVDKALHVNNFTIINSKPYTNRKPYKAPLCYDPWLVRVTGHPQNVRSALIAFDFKKVAQERNGKFVENQRGVAIWLSFNSKSDAIAIANKLNGLSYRGHTLSTSIEESRLTINRDRPTLNQIALEVDKENTRSRQRNPSSESIVAPCCCLL